MPAALILIPALLTLCAIAYYAVTFYAAYDWLKQPPPSRTAPLPPVSILKPLKGCDPEMYESFRSHCVLDHPEYEIIFGVSSEDDEAVPYVRRLQQEFPQRTIQLVVCPEVLGGNRKVSNLVQMSGLARYQHLLIDDSDILVPANHLSEVMSWFQPGVTAPQRNQKGKTIGMVTCLYRAGVGKSIWTKLEKVGIAMDFMPGALTARLLEGHVRFGLGATLAVRKDALQTIGGLQTLVDYIADDYELASHIVDAGFAVVASKPVVETSLSAYDFPTYYDHQLRWGRTVRSSRPGGYAGLVVTFGFLWSLLTIITSRGALWAWSLLGVVVLLRVATALVYGKLLGDEHLLGDLWLLPVRDLSAPFFWLMTLWGKRIVWRGDVFELQAGKIRKL